MFTSLRRGPPPPPPPSHTGSGSKQTHVAYSEPMGFSCKLNIFGEIHHFMPPPPLSVVGAWDTGCRVVGGEGWLPRPLSEPLAVWGRGYDVMLRRSFVVKPKNKSAKLSHSRRLLRPLTPLTTGESDAGASMRQLP